MSTDVYMWVWSEFEFGVNMSLEWIWVWSEFEFVVNLSLDVSTLDRNASDYVPFL